MLGWRKYLTMASLMLLYSSCFWQYTIKFLCFFYSKLTILRNHQFGSAIDLVWQSIPGHVSGCHKLEQGVCCRHLVSRGQGMLLNILHCTGQDSKQLITWLKMLIMLTLRNPDLDLLDSLNWLIYILL